MTCLQCRQQFEDEGQSGYVPCDQVEFPIVDEDSDRYPGCPYVPSPARSELTPENAELWDLFTDIKLLGWQGAMALRTMTLTHTEAEETRELLRFLFNYTAQLEQPVDRNG